MKSHFPDFNIKSFYKAALFRNLNKQMVSMQQLTDQDDIKELRSIIEKHVNATGSDKGKMILDNFEEYIPHFKKIIPEDYERMIDMTAEYESKGRSHEEAEIEAFNRLVG